jgi:RNA polymerase sigma-70 factor (ECF subfamily)
MDAYLDGDDRALTAVFRQLAPRIRRLVSARIDDPDLVDDIVQLTFVKAHRGRHAFRARADRGDDALRRGDAFVAWYLAIARNTAVDGMRSEHRHQHRRVRPLAVHHADDPVTSPVIDDIPAIDADPESQWIELERRESTRDEVRAAIAALPAGQREVVVLHKLGGLPMHEVAAKVGIRPGAARVRAHRAYLTLGTTLQHTVRPVARAPQTHAA